MFCPNCGAPISGSEKFCMKCGTSLAAHPPIQAQTQTFSQAPPQPQSQAFSQTPPQPQASANSPAFRMEGDESWRQHASSEENASVQGQRVSPNVYLGRDGVYRWVYEIKLSGNSAVLHKVMKFFAIIFLVVLVMFMIPMLTMGGFSDSENIIGFALIWLGVMAAVGLISFVSVQIYSAFMGGTFWDIFEMDNEKITEVQMDKSFEKTKALGFVLFLMADDASGMINAMRTATQKRTEFRFDKIRAIKLDTKRDCIELSGMMLCLIFAKPEDYNFVLNHILAHVPRETAQKFHAKYH